MRIDAHVRFWRYHPAEHQWMSPEMQPVQRDCLPEEVEPLLASRDFDGCVALQSRHKLVETRFLLELADHHPFIAGVVGWVDLRSPRVAAQLDEFVVHPKFKGVRHILHDEPDDELMLGEDFRRGIAETGARGLSYDLLVYVAHLPVATQLVDAFPNQRFVIDHIGKPLVQNRLLSPWQERIRELAKRENVVGKISGLMTEVDWNAWRPDDFTPYLEVALDAFGPDRLMIGSDWPMCNLSGDYERVTGVWLDFISRLSPEEQAQVCGGVAERVYRL